VAEANTVHVAGDNAVELDQWPVERLEREITELAAPLNAAECRWLVLWPSSTGARGGPSGSAGHVPTGSTGSAGSISAPPARRCGSLDQLWGLGARTEPVDPHRYPMAFGRLDGWKSRCASFLGHSLLRSRATSFTGVYAAAP
jgi:hypothetical protein